MKIFVDVNPFLDIQRKREGWAKSLDVVQSVVERRNIGYISALTPAIIYFLRKPVTGDAKARQEMLDSIQGFRIVSLTNKIIRDAARDEMIRDFEDALQFHCAKKAARILVTGNTKDFTKISGQVEVMTPEDFLEKYPD